MAARRDLKIAAQIGVVEQRMALRRQQIAADVEATRAHARRTTDKAMRWLPIAAVASALVVGFMAARRGRRPARAPLSVAPMHAAPPKRMLATVLAMAAGALRFAASAEGRMAWRALRTARDHARWPRR